METIRAHELKEGEHADIREVMLLNHQMYQFSGGRYMIVPPLLTGTLEDGTNVKRPLKDVTKLNTSGNDSINFNQIDAGSVFAVILKDNTLVMFNEEGGTFNAEDNTIEAKSIKDRYISLEADSIQEILTVPEGNMDTSASAIQNASNITQAVIKGDPYTFDENGGRVICPMKIISGITLANEVVSISYDSVLYVNALTPDGGNTTLLVLGIIAGIILIAALVSYSTWEMDFGDWNWEY
jgi:hypothetical protein